MKLYIGIFVGLLGVVLLLAGGNGAAFKAWNVFFGKGLPDKTTGANNTPPGGTAAGGAIIGGSALVPGITLPGIGAIVGGAAAVPSSFHGTNTITGQGMTA